MWIADLARERPDAPAYVMAEGGTALTWRDLNERSIRLARLLARCGLGWGDHFAFLLGNEPEFVVACWAGQRSGLYYTAISTRFTPEEVAHVLTDSGARVFITSPAVAGVAAPLTALIPASVERRFIVGGRLEGYGDGDAALAAEPAEPLPEEWEGQSMLYSGGTTGLPKGVKPFLLRRPAGEPMVPVEMYSALYRVPDAVVLLTAPLYHNAQMVPLIFSGRRGDTVVIMQRFDPEATLAAIERHRVTWAQFVPTMFIRMLKLPEEVRHRYDLSSLRVAFHGAGPCPIEVKRQMIDWLGPILLEYYGATEPVGGSFIDSHEWLAHPGSVGRSTLGPAHILDEEGNELPPGQPGLLYFEPPSWLTFGYHKDPARTKAATSKQGWVTVGDVARLDEEGYIYLTDRASFTIISGGVNIFPQEVENVLINHPGVYDCAVIGVPHPEMGEEVKAVVSLVPGTSPGPEVEQELIGYCRDRLAHYKCPKSVDFVDSLPRSETGKLFKKELRASYWAGRDRAI
jgi:acyl-CoA synthetase (AMP-forming)/AMP-acid ligase II